MLLTKCDQNEKLSANLRINGTEVSRYEDMRTVSSNWSPASSSEGHIVLERDVCDGSAFHLNAGTSGLADDGILKSFVGYELIA